MLVHPPSSGLAYTTVPIRRRTGHVLVDHLVMPTSDREPLVLRRSGVNAPALRRVAMSSLHRFAVLLLAAAILAGCATAGEVNRLNAELDAANQRNAALLEAKARHCGEMTSAAARVEQAKARATGSNVASTLLGGAIDWMAGKPVTTALKILLPDLFTGTGAPPPHLVAATRDLSAGIARYCDGAGSRKPGSS
jgi:hypothetical protein